MDSGKCFVVWEVFLDSDKCFEFREVFWILGSVFGFWEVFVFVKVFVPMSHRNNHLCGGDYSGI